MHRTRPLSVKGKGPPRATPTLGMKVAFAAGGLALSAATIGLVFWDPFGSSSSSKADELPLDPSYFSRARVTSSVTSDSQGLTKHITLKIPKEKIPPRLDPVYSIYLKDSDIQVERPYTPLKGIGPDGEMTFWVKKYEKGEVGRWFHRRKVGEDLEIRGPVRTLDVEDGKWDEVVLVSGGTGITPYYQLLHNVFAKGRLSQTHFTLVHASSSSATLPPPEIMNDLKRWADQNPERLSLKIFVDKKEDTSTRDVEVREGRVDVLAIEEVRKERGLVREASWSDWRKGQREPSKTDKRVLFVVCGPESMINSIGGQRKIRPSDRIPLGGILGAMGYTHEDVRKL